MGSGAHCERIPAPLVRARPRRDEAERAAARTDRCSDHVRPQRRVRAREPHRLPSGGAGMARGADEAARRVAVAGGGVHADEREHCAQVRGRAGHGGQRGVGHSAGDIAQGQGEAGDGCVQGEEECGAGARGRGSGAGDGDADMVVVCQWAG